MYSVRLRVLRCFAGMHFLGQGREISEMLFCLNPIRKVVKKFGFDESILCIQFQLQPPSFAKFLLYFNQKKKTKNKKQNSSRNYKVRCFLLPSFISEINDFVAPAAVAVTRRDLLPIAVCLSLVMTAAHFHALYNTIFVLDNFNFLELFCGHFPKRATKLRFANLQSIHSSLKYPRLRAFLSTKKENDWPSVQKYSVLDTIKGIKKKD